MGAARSDGGCAPGWAILVDPEGRILASDPELGRWIGTGEGRLVGREISSLPGSPMQRALARAVTATFSRRESWETESMIGGRELRFRTRFVADSVGGVDLVLVLVEDRSGQHQTVRAFMDLRRTHAAVRTLTDRVVAHAAAIRGEIAALRWDTPAISEPGAALDALERGVDRLLAEVRAEVS